MKIDYDLSRLCKSIRHSRQVLKRFREERKEAVEQLAGSHWSEETKFKEVPINLVGQYVSIMTRNLIAKEPRVMLSVFEREMKPIVSAMESWVNEEIVESRLADTLQRVVVDALFSVGIVKVAVATPADSVLSSWEQEAGEPMAEAVDLDDFVFDVHARTFKSASYIGHRYRVPKEVARAMYGKRVKDVTPSTDQIHNVDGDERIGTLGRGQYAGDSQEFEDFIDLWEVYLPRHRVVLTLLDDQIAGATGEGDDGIDEPLKEQEWVGPYCGPYHVLAFGIVPGNAMPKAPVQDLIDLHKFANETFRKLIRQTARQKDVTFVRGSATEDADRVMKSNDGDILRVDNPEAIAPLSMGGANQQNMAMFLATKAEFDTLAGNLSIIGGLAPQSKTATQDKMLNENSSLTVSDKQEKVLAFTASVLEALCWFWYNNPHRAMETTYAPQGLPELSIQRKITPEQRKPELFDKIVVKVDPYSMQHSTPQSKLAALNQVVQTTIMPMMPLLDQQGIGFDINAYLLKVAKYLDMPDLSEIIMMREPSAPVQEGGGEEEAQMGPSETTRNYVRESMPGRTQKGNDQMLMNAMMGASGGEGERQMQMAGA